MIYKQTVEEIRSTAMLVNPSGGFGHGKPVDLSLATIRSDFPLIWLYPWKITDPPPSQFLHNHPIIIGFWKQDRPDTSEEEREQIIHEMEILKDAFMAKLRELYPKFDIQNVVSEPQYQMHAGTVSGYAVSFSYKNYTLCP